MDRSVLLAHSIHLHHPMGPIDVSEERGIGQALDRMHWKALFMGTE